MIDTLKALQAEIHSNFIGLVRESRGVRLTGPEKTLFSGEYWLAGPALEYGLIDRIGDIRSVLREKFGDKVQLPVIAPGRRFLSRLVPGMKLAGIAGGAEIDLADEIVSTMEARAIWARFGF